MSRIGHERVVVPDGHHPTIGHAAVDKALIDDVLHQFSKCPDIRYESVLVNVDDDVGRLIADAIVLVADRGAIHDAFLGIGQVDERRRPSIHLQVHRPRENLDPMFWHGDHATSWPVTPTSPVTLVLRQSATGGLTASAGNL